MSGIEAGKLQGVYRAGPFTCDLPDCHDRERHDHTRKGFMEVILKQVAEIARLREQSKADREARERDYKRYAYENDELKGALDIRNKQLDAEMLAREKADAELVEARKESAYLISRAESQVAGLREELDSTQAKLEHEKSMRFIKEDCYEKALERACSPWAGIAQEYLDRAEKAESQVAALRESRDEAEEALGWAIDSISPMQGQTLGKVRAALASLRSVREGK